MSAEKTRILILAKNPSVQIGPVADVEWQVLPEDPKPGFRYAIENGFALAISIPGEGDAQQLVADFVRHWKSKRPSILLGCTSTRSGLKDQLMNRVIGCSLSGFDTPCRAYDVEF